jgi:hypothetical protein
LGLPRAADFKSFSNLKNYVHNMFLAIKLSTCGRNAYRFVMDPTLQADAGAKETCGCEA